MHTDRLRVILFCNQHLLGESLAQVLVGAQDIEVLGTWPLNDALLAQVAGISPDVVIIGEEDQDVQWITCITGEILESYPELVVIRVNVNRNVFRVYSSRVLPARSSDLIEMVHSLPTLQGGVDEKLEDGGK